MQREYVENIIRKDIKNYSILFALFGLLLSVLDEEIYFTDLEQRKIIDGYEDKGAYYLYANGIALKMEPQVELGVLSIDVIDKREEINKGKEKRFTLTIFPEGESVIVDNKNGTKISVFNSHKSIFIDSNCYFNGYYKFDKLMTDPYKVDRVREAFKNIDNTCCGMMEYIKIVSPNVRNSICEIMGDSIEQPPQK